MSDFDEHSITEAVVRRFEDTPDPRLKQLMQSLVRHLHAYVQEVEPTFDEWLAAVMFLTRTGQICDDKRQEFILLSDTLGVSMLVDAINHRMPAGATESTVLGPFYVANPPEKPQGADVSAGAKGTPLYADVQVRSAGGAPIEGAVIDIWQSDDHGFYDVQKPDEYPEPALRARFRTDAAGHAKFWSITPTAYPIPYDGPVGDMLKATNRHPWRPAHLHFMISAPGHQTLVTHLFVEGDQYLDSDAVFGVKASLIDAFPHQVGGSAPDGRVMDGPWRKLDYGFGLKPVSAL